MEIKNKILPQERRGKLKKLLEQKSFVRIIEAHNGISGIIGEQSSIVVDGEKKEFDALWISSLTDSIAKGYPDEEIVSIDSRINTVNQILNVTSKPIIYDADTGGFKSQLNYLIKQLERIGVSAVVIEDKKYPKSNSLLDGVTHKQATISEFVNQIRYAKESRNLDDFLIIARIESLICGASEEDAIQRAMAYLDAGADGIMIHSKSKSPNEILSFAKLYNQLYFSNGRKPLMCVPTTYHEIYEKDLVDCGFNIVLYANHQLRSAFKAMDKVCESILQEGRSTEASEMCASLKEIMDPVGSLRNYEAEYE